MEWMAAHTHMHIHTYTHRNEPAHIHTHTHCVATAARTEAEAVGGVREQAQLHHLQLQPVSCVRVISGRICQKHIGIEGGTHDHEHTDENKDACVRTTATRSGTRRPNRSGGRRPRGTRRGGGASSAGRPRRRRAWTFVCVFVCERGVRTRTHWLDCGEVVSGSTLSQSHVHT